MRRPPPRNLLPALTVLAMAAAAAALGGCNRAPTPAELPFMKVAVGGSPATSPDPAWVTVVVWGDFECPYCRNADPTVMQAVAARPGDVRLVWKHFPLWPMPHPDARPAAIAAECAHDQDRFWPMHDLLLTGALAEADLLAKARAVDGLDVTAWQACTAATGPGTAAARVDADLQEGMRLGIGGTPTYVVNGSVYVGLPPAFAWVLDTAVAHAAGSGIPKAEYYDVAVMGR